MKTFVYIISIIARVDRVNRSTLLNGYCVKCFMGWSIDLVLLHYKNPLMIFVSQVECINGKLLKAISIFKITKWTYRTTQLGHVYHENIPYDFRISHWYLRYA